MTEDRSKRKREGIARAIAAGRRRYWADATLAAGRRQ
jgi:hypothetical protein